MSVIVAGSTKISATLGSGAILNLTREPVSVVGTSLLYKKLAPGPGIQEESYEADSGKA